MEAFGACASNPASCANTFNTLGELFMGDALGGHTLGTVATGTVGAAAVADEVVEQVASKADDVARSAGSAVNQARLNSQLIAEDVANGHAYTKHVVEGQEFAELGISTKQQFQDFVENIVSNPAIDKRYAADGRVFYLDYATKTDVIRISKGESTAFRPDFGQEGVCWSVYVRERVPRNTTPNGG